MRARRNFRNDAAEGRVERILGADHVRQQSRTRLDDGRRRLIARGFDRQDAPVGDGYCGVLRSSPSISSVSRISRKRFLKLAAWIESDHITIASSLLSV